MARTRNWDTDIKSATYRKRLIRDLGKGNESVARRRYESGEYLGKARGHGNRETPEHGEAEARKAVAKGKGQRYERYLRSKQAGMRAITNYGTVWIKGLRFHDRQRIGRAWNYMLIAAMPDTDEKTRTRVEKWLARNDGKRIGDYPGVTVAVGDLSNGAELPDEPDFAQVDNLRLVTSEAAFDDLYFETDTAWDTIYERNN
jgi:hypothetical protein